MTKILVCYATLSGSTAEVAAAIAEELDAVGLRVDLSPIQEVNDLSGYDGVVLGAPMVVGWHRSALRIIRRHRLNFERRPLAVFVTAMTLTRTEDMQPSNARVYVDPDLPRDPQSAGRLSLREKYSTLANYLRPIRRACGAGQPVSIGVFGGSLMYDRLKWWAAILAMLIVRAAAGDRRNWDAIREWARGLPHDMELNLVRSVA